MVLKELTHQFPSVYLILHIILLSSGVVGQPDQIFLTCRATHAPLEIGTSRVVIEEGQQLLDSNLGQDHVTSMVLDNWRNGRWWPVVVSMEDMYLLPKFSKHQWILKRGVRHHSVARSHFLPKGP